jgi:arabinan endo-1,5-alpha-L-arabinosidase
MGWIRPETISREGGEAADALRLAGKGRAPAGREERMLKSLTVAFLALVTTAALAQPLTPAPVMQGDTQIHDPSAIDVDGHWVTFQTGTEGGLYQGAILLKTSPDGITWTKAGAIGKGVPKWTKGVLGYASRNIWAPTISASDGTYYLYYAVSMFGLNTSTIGLMTNTAFNPLEPGKGWQDQGEVITSHINDDWNAIDPFRIDASDGRAWLSYGSYWSGIKLRELDPKSGKLIALDTPTFHLASRGGGAIEASSILEHAGKFYLFVSYDRCCAGVSSTYRIMVGRADRVTGPYLDKNGTDMMKGGATQLQATLGRYIGPGGEEPVKTPSGDALIYHYYDGEDGGRSKLEIAPIHWTVDGWPELSPPP